MNSSNTIELKKNYVNLYRLLRKVLIVDLDKIIYLLRNVNKYPCIYIKYIYSESMCTHVRSVLVKNIIILASYVNKWIFSGKSVHC